MTGECVNCKRYGIVERHHVVHGRGKRRECETPESVVYLCPLCHRGSRGVHGKDGHALDMRLKRDLQARYFAQRREEQEVRRLMGGKLVLDERGEIAGARPNAGDGHVADNA